MNEGWPTGPDRAVAGDAELHVWRAELDSIEARPAIGFRRAIENGPSGSWSSPAGGAGSPPAGHCGGRSAAISTTSPPRSWSSSWTRTGKPRIAGPTPVRFNLSHSEGLALIAVTAAGEVGVDIERVDLDRDFLELSRHGLDRESAALVREAPAAGRPAAFYRAWVRREAVGKCTGAGLTGPASGEGVAVREIDAGESWAAAIALAGPASLPLRLFAA